MTSLRVRRTRGEVASILAKYQASGLSARVFAARGGFALPTLYQWIRAARTQSRGGSRQGAHPSRRGQQRRFLSVDLHNALEAPASGGTVRVGLGNGRWLEIPPGIRPDSLSELLKVLLECLAA